MSTFLAEFVGTAILIILGDGVVANVVLSKTKGHGSGWIVIATGWGLAVALAVYCVGQFSGAHLNPAVTVGLAAIKEVTWEVVPTYLAARLHRSLPSLDSLSGSLERDRGPGYQAGRLLHRPRPSQHARQSGL